MTKFTKIVYNDKHGGFGLSDAAMHLYAELKGLKLYPENDGERSRRIFTTYWTVPPEERTGHLTGDAWYNASIPERQASNSLHDKLTILDRDIPRHDRHLVQVVEKLGKEANGEFASLKIAEVRKGERYRIDEYDGAESVMTVDDYEWETA